MNIINLDEDPERWSIVRGIIDHFLGTSPDSVKIAIYDYADGNPGCATVLCQKCLDLTTAVEVEALVGWPLNGERREQGHEIYDRLK